MHFTVNTGYTIIPNLQSSVREKRSGTLHKLITELDFNKPLMHTGSFITGWLLFAKVCQRSQSVSLCVPVAIGGELLSVRGPSEVSPDAGFGDSSGFPYGSRRSPVAIAPVLSLQPPPSSLIAFLYMAPICATVVP